MSNSIGLHVVKTADISTVTTTPATSTGGAGTVFLVTAGWISGGATPTVVDNKGNVFTLVGSVIDSGLGYWGGIWKCEGTNGGPAGAPSVGGSGHTFTVTSTGGGGGAIGVFVDEVLGCPITGAAVDQAPIGLFSNTSPFLSTTSGTTSQASELVFAGVITGSSSGTETLTWNNGFTQIDSSSNANTDITGGTASKLVTSVGTYQSSFTSAGAGTTNAISFLVTVKALVAAVTANGIFFGAGTTS